MTAWLLGGRRLVLRGEAGGGPGAAWTPAGALGAPRASWRPGPPIAWHRAPGEVRLDTGGWTERFAVPPEHPLVLWQLEGPAGAAWEVSWPVHPGAVPAEAITPPGVTVVSAGDALTLAGRGPAWAALLLARDAADAARAREAVAARGAAGLARAAAERERQAEHFGTAVTDADGTRDDALDDARRRLLARHVECAPGRRAPLAWTGAGWRLEPGVAADAATALLALGERQVARETLAALAAAGAEDAAGRLAAALASWAGDAPGAAPGAAEAAWPALDADALAATHALRASWQLAPDAPRGALAVGWPAGAAAGRLTGLRVGATRLDLARRRRAQGLAVAATRRTGPPLHLALTAATPPGAAWSVDDEPLGGDGARFLLTREHVARAAWPGP